MNVHILIVDDEAPTRELLSIYFRRRGCAVTTARNAEDALRLVNELPVQLVILDVNLGQKTTGLDLVEPMKKVRPHTPIILFSGVHLDEKKLQAALENSDTSFLSKTQPLDEMWAEVQRALGNLSGHPG